MASKHSKRVEARGKNQPRGGQLGTVLCLLALIAVIGLTTAGALSMVPGGSAADRPPQVVLRDVMTSNPSVCLGVEGRFYDWICLYNAGDAEVSLAGWRLGSRLDLRGAYVFGDVTMAAGEKRIVYCAAAPEDYAGDAIFTGFTLSSDGGSLILSDVGERHMQVLDVPAMPVGCVYERDEDTQAYSVTPFFRSQDASEFAPDMCPAHDPAGVSISEVMALNGDTLADGDGDRSDWIELYNGGGAPVSLGGWSISDDDLNRRKWVFPDVTLGAGEYRIVFASGKDRADPAGELHTSFRLSASGESLRLYDADAHAVSWASLGEAQKDKSVARQPDGTLLEGCEPSPGYPNTQSGTRAWLHATCDAITVNDQGLYVNEVFCSGKGMDWLELANTGAEAVDLSGMGLSDDPLHPRKWQFPEGSSLPAGGYALVYLTGSDGQSGASGGKYAANLALAPEETVTLARPDGTIIDRVRLLDQHRDVSFGRAAGQTNYRYFGKPTPGAANTSPSYATCASEVRFSLPGGAYRDKTIRLELSSDEGMTIYYTTDGSSPTPGSHVYTGPLEISKNCMIQAVAWREGALQSPVVIHSFAVGLAHDMRVVFVVGSSSKLSKSGGVLNTGYKTEQKVFVQMYEPDGTRSVSQVCDLKVAGHNSRVNYAQKGFTLRARKKYGEGKFHAKLFSNRDYEEYDSLFLRASGQDATQTHMRDSILTSLAADTTVLYQETELCVVYVNGKYWGTYNMRERISKEMVAQYEGWGNPDDVVMREGGGADLSGIVSKARHMDFTQDASVDKLRQVVDVENYLDYVALQMYTANQDLNNVRCYCIPKAGVKWRWILYDQDLSYQIDANSPARWLKSGGVGTITSQDNTLFILLMKNAKMRDYFLTRMGQLLKTSFSANNVVSKIRERCTALQSEMKLTCKRWGWSYDTWKRYCTKMAHYAQSRPGKLAGYLKSAFRLSNEQAKRYFA